MLPPADPPPRDRPTAAGPQLRTLVVYSLVAGVCPLIPIPLVDDWILDRVRRRLAERLAASCSLRLRPDRLKMLADREPANLTLEGLAKGCLRRLFVAPVKFVYKRIVRKLFRKILFVLAIKDAVDELSGTFHHGWLLYRALEQRGAPASLADARTLRRGIDRVCDEIDPRPVESAVRSALRHSRKLLRRIAWVLGALIRRRGGRGVDEAVQRTESEAAGLVDELIASLGRETGYLEALHRRLDETLDATVQPGSFEMPSRHDQRVRNAPCP